MQLVKMPIRRSVQDQSASGAVAIGVGARIAMAQNARLVFDIGRDTGRLAAVPYCAGNGGRNMAADRRLRLGAFMRPVGIHTAWWRYPGAYPDANFNLEAPDPLRAEARARAVRRLVHGRPSGRAQHADGGA